MSIHSAIRAADSDSVGALTPYRALEVGDGAAAAVLGMLLADQGADVIKLEHPRGDPLRGTPVFSVWNRGKSSVVIDPCADDYASRLSALMAASDVVIESWRSARDPDALRFGRARADTADDAIYVRLPGFDDGHPENLETASELAVSASAGVYADRSRDGSEGVSFIALPYATVFGAMVAAPAVVAALFHRHRVGEGQTVTVPLYDAMFTAMGSAIVRRPDVPAGRGALSPVIRRFYRCGDGRWINLNAGYERSLRPILDTLGHPDWYGPLTDERLYTNTEELEEWDSRFAEAWLSKTALEWEHLMAGAGVPLTMCRTLREWMETDHARVSGAVVEIDDPMYGPMRQVGVQVRMSDTPGVLRGGAPPLGRDTDAVFDRLRER